MRFDRGVGIVMSFLALLAGVGFGGATENEIVGLVAFSLVLVVPGVFGRLKRGWTQYEIGVGLGFAIVIGIALLLMGLCFGYFWIFPYHGG